MLYLFQPSVGRVIDQVDIVPTTSLVLGLPIPFSNLGTFISEVLLPYTGPEMKEKMQNPAEDEKNEDKHSRGHADGEVRDGYTGRVTLHFLDALKANAEQLHTYLMTYVQYSGDFPADDFKSLEIEFSSIMDSYRQLTAYSGTDRSGTPAPQQTLTEMAGKFISYTKSVKRMCSQVWAKFDDFPIKQGLLLLAVSVAASTIMLLDVHEALHAISTSLPIGGAVGAILGAVLLLILGIEVSVLGFLASLLNFVFACLLSILTVSLIQFRTVIHKNLLRFLKFLKSMGVLAELVWHADLLQVLAILLLAIHAATMFSNSFILYEADMLAFFIQSMIAGFAIRDLQNEFMRKYKKFRFPLKDMLVTLAPYLVIMTCVRLSKAFYACRDLQIQDGCYSTSFIQGLTSTGDSLGGLANWRLAASCLSVATVPVSFALLLRLTGLRTVLGRTVAVLIESALGLCVLCVWVHWNVQSLPQNARLSLAPWQHTAAPLSAYCVAAVIIVAAVFRLFRTSDVNRLLSGRLEAKYYGVKHSAVSSVTRQQQADNYDGPRQRTKGREKEKSDTVFETMEAVLRPGTGALMGVAVAVIVVALWVPLAMLLNDGIALSAFLTAVEMGCVLYIFKKQEKGMNVQR